MSEFSFSEPLSETEMAELLKKMKGLRRLTPMLRVSHLTKIWDDPRMTKYSMIEKHEIIMDAFRRQLDKAKSLISALAVDVRGDWSSDVDVRVENMLSIAINYHKVEKIIYSDKDDHVLRSIVSFLKEIMNRDPDYVSDGRFLREMPLYGMYWASSHDELYDEIGEDLYDAYGNLFLTVPEN